MYARQQNSTVDCAAATFAATSGPTSGVKKRIRQLPKNYPKNTLKCRQRRRQRTGGTGTSLYARPAVWRRLLKNDEGSAQQTRNNNADMRVCAHEV